MITAKERLRILSEAKPNSWVAFSSDESRLVSCGETYSEAVENTEKNGESDPVILKIPDTWELTVFCA